MLQGGDVSFLAWVSLWAVTRASVRRGVARWARSAAGAVGGAVRVDSQSAPASAASCERAMSSRMMTGTEVGGMTPASVTTMVMNSAEGASEARPVVKRSTLSWAGPRALSL